MGAGDVADARDARSTHREADRVGAEDKPTADAEPSVQLEVDLAVAIVDPWGVIRVDRRLIHRWPLTAHDANPEAEVMQQVEGAIAILELCLPQVVAAGIRDGEVSAEIVGVLIAASVPERLSGDRELAALSAEAGELALLRHRLRVADERDRMRVLAAGEVTARHAHFIEREDRIGQPAPTHSPGIVATMPLWRLVIKSISLLRPFSVTTAKSLWTRQCAESALRKRMGSPACALIGGTCKKLIFVLARALSFFAGAVSSWDRRSGFLAAFSPLAVGAMGLRSQRLDPELCHQPPALSAPLSPPFLGWCRARVLSVGCPSNQGQREHQGQHAIDDLHGYHSSPSPPPTVKPK